MNTRELVYTKICLIIEELSVIDNAITPETSLIDDLGFESLSLITLLLKTEEAFDLCLDFDNFGFEIFNSVNTYTDFVMGLISNS